MKLLLLLLIIICSTSLEVIAQSHSKSDQNDSTRTKSPSTLQPKVNVDSNKQERRQVRFSPVRELQTDIDGLVSTPELSNASIGISIVSIENGEYFYRKNETKNFIPASTLKTLTTAAALEYLGRDFRYSTKIYFDGEPPKDGEFTGNMIIRASGDPTMSSFFYADPIDVLEVIALKLDSLGIRSIRGNIIADDSYFDDNYYAAGWALDDVMYPYSAQVNALSFGDNKVDVRVVPAQNIGELSKITMQPDNTYVRIINNTLTVPSDIPEILTPYREPRTNSIEIRGKIPFDTKLPNTTRGTRMSLTIDNPSLFFLNLFKQTLEKHGIKVRGALLDYEL